MMGRSWSLARPSLRISGVSLPIGKSEGTGGRDSGADPEDAWAEGDRVGDELGFNGIPAAFRSDNQGSGFCDLGEWGFGAVGFAEDERILGLFEDGFEIGQDLKCGEFGSIGDFAGLASDDLEPLEFFVEFGGFPFDNGSAGGEKDDVGHSEFGSHADGIFE